MIGHTCFSTSVVKKTRVVKSLGSNVIEIEKGRSRLDCWWRGGLAGGGRVRRQRRQVGEQEGHGVQKAHQFYTGRTTAAPSVKLR